MEELNLEGGPEWLGYVAGLAYWINACTDDCEVDD
jgi:hypothetical protein